MGDDTTQRSRAGANSAKDEALGSVQPATKPANLSGAFDFTSPVAATTFVTDSFPVGENKTVSGSAVVAFGTSAHIDLAPEFSNDEGATWDRVPSVDNSTTPPQVAGLVLRFLAADWPDGRFPIPTFSVPDAHFLRFQAIDDGVAGDADITAFNLMGGIGQ